MLNHLWLGFFLIAAVCGVHQWLWVGDSGIFATMVETLFSSARLACDVALGLVGALCFWLGLLKILEAAGGVAWLARFLSPVFRCLMPGVPAGHPALGSVTMNLAANMLGLDNAATPFGIRAMEQLQELNPQKDTATDAQIMFLVINTASVTLLPVTIFLYRAQAGAADPASVFIPILLTTALSTLSGVALTAWIQKLPLWRWGTMLFGLGAGIVLGGMIAYFSSLPSPEVTRQSSLLGNLTLLGAILAILTFSARRNVAVYDRFIEGAKEGFHTAIRILPYLVAMLVAIGIFRASGALELLLNGIRWLCGIAGVDDGFVPALPTALMKPFSGSGARALWIDTMHTLGPDSFASLTASVIQGSSETTFYILAVYFGAVGVTKIRYALLCGLFADSMAIIGGIFISYAFF